MTARGAVRAAPDATTMLARTRAVEWAESATGRRFQLVREIAKLSASIRERRRELQSDEGLRDRLIAELEAIERGEARKAAAYGPTPAPLIGLDEACSLARRSRGTMIKYAVERGFGWKSGGRWTFSRPEIIEWMNGAPNAA